jgi:hypothetical protein
VARKSITTEHTETTEIPCPLLSVLSMASVVSLSSGRGPAALDHSPHLEELANAGPIPSRREAKFCFY